MNNDAANIINKLTEEIKNMSNDEFLKYCDKIGFLFEEDLAKFYDIAFSIYEALYVLNVENRFLVAVVSDNNKFAPHYEEDEIWISFTRSEKFSTAKIKESDIKRLDICNDFPCDYSIRNAKKITKEIFLNGLKKDEKED